MAIILVGGSGLVGQGLAARLASQGRQVVILTRDPARRKARPNITYRRWDGQTASGWADLAEGSEAIFNLAGESIGGTNLARIFLQRWSRARKNRILESRLSAGRAIVEALRAARVKPAMLVQMSAVGIYGPNDHPALEETAPPGGDFLAGVCPAWEASTEEAETLGVRRVVVRTGLVLSLRGGLFPVILLPFRLFVGGRLGSGLQGVSWIHAEDQARALLHLLDDQEARGVFNLTAPAPVSNSELGRAVARALHRPFWFPVPAFLLRILLGEKATLVLDGQRVIPAALTARGFTFQFPTLESALGDLLGK